ncbi:hypothetical protein R1flu_013047 [Riccia fluitans]|uniref:Uncharacterized protein n=1 Tax=Riccia fluitans TaxID=41844 RepID=A0ABD1ZCI6_9MARC
MYPRLNFAPTYLWNSTTSPLTLRVSASGKDNRWLCFLGKLYDSNPAVFWAGTMSRDRNRDDPNIYSPEVTTITGSDPKNDSIFESIEVPTWCLQLTNQDISPDLGQAVVR